MGAVEDLELCLARRVASLPSDSRCIAETHYQLGIAQGFDMKWEEAVVSLKAAIKVLETRVANLKASTDSKKVEAKEKEATELEALIPEIREKITDTNEMKAESIRKMREAVGFPAAGGSSDGASGSSGSPKPVASIAIKRKGEAGGEKESEAKKVKEGGDSLKA